MGRVGAGGRRALGVCALVGLVVGAWALLALGARAKEGEQVMADEPQYLLSALSLYEDGNLWIDDELAAERYRPFYDIVLPVQTQPLDDGHSVSPHDPLLPALLAVPMGLGGWAAAKATLAALGGVLAGLLVWVAHRRFAVPLGPAAATVLAFGLTAPLTAYATQVYPELPAALAVTAAIACLTAPPLLGSSRTAGAAVATGVGGPGRDDPARRPSPGEEGTTARASSQSPAVTGAPSLWARWLHSIRGPASMPPAVPSPAGAGRGVRAGLGSPVLGWVVAVVALPWLGVKYAPVAGVLAVVGLVQLLRAGRVRAAVGAVVGLAAAGGAYLLAHRLLYGGWTVYAAGDHFAEGELTVMGHDPDYAGRSQRVVGLLLDRGFGLAAWMPGYLLMVPALVVVARRRPPGWTALVLPLVAGWATATWMALTMHGWWWPGRQTVVVLPCVVLAVAWWAGRLPLVRPVVVITAVLGAATWLWLVVEVLQRGPVTLVGSFETTANPLYRAWRAVLPDFRDPGVADAVLVGMWAALLAGATLAAARAGTPRTHDGENGDASQRAGTTASRQERRPTHVPA